jgi:hypothetical protein
MTAPFRGVATAALVALAATFGPATALAVPAPDPCTSPNGCATPASHTTSPPAPKQNTDPPTVDPKPAADPKPVTDPTTPSDPSADPGPVGPTDPSPPSHPSHTPAGPTGPAGPVDATPANGVQPLHHQPAGPTGPAGPVDTPPADKLKPAADHTTPPADPPKSDEPPAGPAGTAHTDQNQSGYHQDPSPPHAPAQQTDHKPDHPADHQSDHKADHPSDHKSDQGDKGDHGDKPNHVDDHTVTCRDHEDEDEAHCPRRTDVCRFGGAEDDEFFCILDSTRIRLGGCTTTFSDARGSAIFLRLFHQRDVFRVSVRGVDLPEGTVLTVRIDMTEVGSLTLNKRGRGSLTRRGDHLPRVERLDGGERVTVSEDDGTVVLSRACANRNNDDGGDGGGD